MSTSRPFKYNPSNLAINGTNNFGNLAVGTPVDGFEATGIWWNGPDEELGYVIAKPVPLDNQDTPVPGDDLILDPTFTGPGQTDIALSNNNQTATQIFSYQQSVLGQTEISGPDKVMFSVKFTSTNPTVGVGSRAIGVGRPSMNYNGNPFGGYPGNDTESIGFSDNGMYYFNGATTSGYPTWTSGDIIDIAISHGQYWWIRVNGGNWNNNPSANPKNLTGGATLNGVSEVRPALCPSIYGKMEVLNIPQYGCPVDYNFLGHTTASVGFLRSSALTDPSFIELVNVHFGQVFTTIGECLSYLSINGYWNSYPV